MHYRNDWKPQNRKFDQNLGVCHFAVSPTICMSSFLSFPLLFTPPHKLKFLCWRYFFSPSGSDLCRVECSWELQCFKVNNCRSNRIQIMHIREVVSKNYSPRGNCIKVWNTRGWKPSVFWIFRKLPRVDNFTNDRSPNVHYLFYKIVSKIWAVVSNQILTAQSDGGGNYHSQGAVHTGPSITPGEGGGGGGGW